MRRREGEVLPPIARLHEKMRNDTEEEETREVVGVRSSATITLSVSYVKKNQRRSSTQPWGPFTHPPAPYRYISIPSPPLRITSLSDPRRDCLCHDIAHDPGSEHSVHDFASMSGALGPVCQRRLHADASLLALADGDSVDRRWDSTFDSELLPFPGDPLYVESLLHQYSLDNAAPKVNSAPSLFKSNYLSKGFSRLASTALRRT